MTGNDQQRQGGRDIDRYFQQYDQRLFEILKLGSQYEIHQHDRNKQDQHHLVEHLPVGEKSSREIDLPVSILDGLGFHFLYDLLRLIGLEVGEGHIFTGLSRHDGLQVLGRRCRHKGGKSYPVSCTVAIGRDLHQRIVDHLRNGFLLIAQ
ncbi:hypothetical protein SDC9_204546 [bioreactor metagenome]|uniref:Uncharacterized protein n=1 Tax=bioreactor metagenome TaxID=1076179 RepID=A0A645JBD7_9ZZZZ